MLACALVLGPSWLPNNRGHGKRGKMKPFSRRLVFIPLTYYNFWLNNVRDNPPSNLEMNDRHLGTILNAVVTLRGLRDLNRNI